MPIHPSTVELIVYKCIEELNHQLPAELKLQSSLDTILIGEGGVLDSLGLITLVVSLEEAMVEVGIHTALLEEEFLVDSEGPLRTVGSLVDLIISKIG
jgi:D-alanine--poly(phosphoribitol) ligase subunit 2